MWFYIIIAVFLLVAGRYYWRNITAEGAWSFRRWNYLFLVIAWPVVAAIILIFGKDIVLEDVLAFLILSAIVFIAIPLQVEILGSIFLHIVLVRKPESIPYDNIKVLKWINKNRHWQSMLARLWGRKMHQRVSDIYDGIVEAIQEPENNAVTKSA